jgi:hypothetical protein
MVAQQVKKLSTFYGTEFSLPCSQEPTIGPILSQLNSVHILTSFKIFFPSLRLCQKIHQVLMKDYEII